LITPSPTTICSTKEGRIDTDNGVIDFVEFSPIYSTKDIIFESSAIVRHKDIKAPS
jgi:hypothetical protein